MSRIHTIFPPLKRLIHWSLFSVLAVPEDMSSWTHGTLKGNILRFYLTPLCVVASLLSRWWIVCHIIRHIQQLLLIYYLVLPLPYTKSASLSLSQKTCLSKKKIRLPTKRTAVLIQTDERKHVQSQHSTAYDFGLLPIHAQRTDKATNQMHSATNLTPKAPSMFMFQCCVNRIYWFVPIFYIWSVL